MHFWTCFSHDLFQHSVSRFWFDVPFQIAVFDAPFLCSFGMFRFDDPLEHLFAMFCFDALLLRSFEMIRFDDPPPFVFAMFRSSFCFDVPF